MSLSNSCNDFVFDMEGNNFMPQRYKKKPYRFSCASDILLLKEVIAVNPYSTLNQRQKWEEVAENLREHFLVDGRRCRERTTLILNYFLSEENSTFRKVGTEEDIKERDKILQELTELKAVSEAVAYSTAKSAAKNTSKSQKDGDIERSLESLSASLEERNNAMSSSSSDEKDDTSSSSKRKRMKREIIDNYVEKKRAAELALKKEELALKKVELAQEQQRINMEKEKFEIEKRERQARFEIEMDIKRTEREERRAMSDLIKQLLSMQHNISLHPEEVIKPN